MAFTDIRGFKLHYIVEPSQADQSERADADRPCYVFSHGLFFGNLSSWYPLFTAELAKRGDTLCYDLRGHGLSEVLPSAYSLSEHVSDLEALLKELSWEDRPICFIGHSFGARVILALSSKRTRSQSLKRDQVLLIDPPLQGSLENDDPLFTHLNERGLEELKKYLPSTLVSMFSSNGRRIRKMLKRWEKLINETTFCEDMAAVSPVTQNELSSLSYADAILFGEDSGCLAGKVLLEGYIEVSRVKVLSGGGHFLLNQDPQYVLDFVLEHAI